MRRRLPAKVDLGFDVIHVREVSANVMRAEADCDPDEQTPDGCWADGKTIYVLKTLSMKNARKAFLHELGHASWDLYNEHE